MAFDPMDKLITAVVGSNTVSARYRADGLRAWKGTNVSIPTSGGTPVTNATYYLYDGGNPVVEMNSSGTVTKVNVFGQDGLVARGLSSTWTYYQFDPQGSVAQRSNTSGSVTSSSKYEAYGKHVNIPGSTVDTYGWNARWGYYYDSESGLYLCQQRYYDSSQGRWLNRDPIGYGGGQNLYGYCGGGPVGAIDPKGLLALALPAAAAVTLGSIVITVVVVTGVVLLITWGINSICQSIVHMSESSETDSSGGESEATWPESAGEMDEVTGVEGKPMPGPSDGTVWELENGDKIVHEQHPYDHPYPNDEAGWWDPDHHGPHWHQIPGNGGGKTTHLPGDPIDSIFGT